MNDFCADSRHANRNQPVRQTNKANVSQLPRLCGLLWCLKSYQIIIILTSPFSHLTSKLYCWLMLFPLQNHTKTLHSLYTYPMFLAFTSEIIAALSDPYLAYIEISFSPAAQTCMLFCGSKYCFHKTTVKVGSVLHLFLNISNNDPVVCEKDYLCKISHLKAWLVLPWPFSLSTPPADWLTMEIYCHDPRGSI